MKSLKKLKKDLGFVYKWMREIQFKKRDIVSYIDENEAWEYVNGIRPHDYTESVSGPLPKCDKQKDISFIVPVYNVEKYLERAVESIASAAEGLDYEIILVEDYSTDSSLEICRALEKKQSRIKLVYTYNEDDKAKNKGLSAGRNKGLDESCGRYICFIDSDDICLNVKSLFEAAEKNNADVVEGNFIIFNDENNIDLSKKHIQRAPIGPVDISNDYNLLSKCAGFAWGKLYKREIWEGVAFPVGFIFEDTVNEARILRAAKRYCFVDVPCYGYRKNLASICYTVNTTPKVLDSVLVYKYWIENISSKDSIFARFTVRQLGSMSYSRIKELPIDDQKKIFVVMGEMLSSLPETKGLGYYEKLLYRAIKQKDFDKWRFLCKYCFV